MIAMFIVLYIINFTFCVLDVYVDFKRGNDIDFGDLFFIIFFPFVPIAFLIVIIADWDTPIIKNKRNKS